MHLKEFVVDPSIAYCSIGDQRYGVSFVTIDADEAFIMRDAARRLLPMAASKHSTIRQRKTAYFVLPFRCVEYASSVTSILGLVEGSAWSSSSICWACGTATSSQSDSSSLSLKESLVDLVISCVDMGVHAQTCEFQCYSCVQLTRPPKMSHPGFVPPCDLWSPGSCRDLAQDATIWIRPQGPNTRLCDAELHSQH